MLRSVLSSSCLVLATASYLAFGMASAAWAGEYNEVLSIGDAAPVWKNLPGTDGAQHGLADLADRDVVVVAFTCASCPTAVDYEGRLNALVQKYGSSPEKVGIAVMCVNQVPADRLPALTKRVVEKELKFHYLYDESQQVAKDFGAIFTPEFYVFNRDRKLVYMGALDDSTDADKVTKRYVEDAITAALTGSQPGVTETIARGCRVRYARMRRE